MFRVFAKKVRLRQCRSLGRQTPIQHGRSSLILCDGTQQHVCVRSRTDAKRSKPTFEELGDKIPGVTKDQLVHRALLDVQDLQNYERHPLGTFLSSHYDMAKGALAVFKKQNVRTPLANDAAILLVERLTQELSVKPNDTQTVWVGNTRMFSGLLNNWKNALKRGESAGMIQPLAMLEKLTAMSERLPTFKEDVVLFNIVLATFIARAPEADAPALAEDLLLQTAHVTPVVETYNPILSAWASSKLPNAAERIQKILTRMREEHISPSVVTYNILLKFWNSQNNVEKIGQTLHDMDQEGVCPNTSSLSQAVRGYARADQLDEAESWLEHMVSMTRSHYDRVELAGSVHAILTAYLNRLKAEKEINRDSTFKAAEEVFNSCKTIKFVPPDKSRIVGAIMNIYTLIGCSEKAYAAYKQVEKSDAVLDRLLIKAYGAADEASKAQAFVKEQLISNQLPAVHLETFNTLVDVWLSSSAVDNLEHAVKVLHLAVEHEQRPTVAICNTVLSHLAIRSMIETNEGRTNFGELAFQLMSALQHRTRPGAPEMHAYFPRPNEMTYSFALVACHNSGNKDHVSVISKRMTDMGLCKESTIEQLIERVEGSLRDH